jgi:branched-chain amino acid transport system permease protein
VSVLAVSLGFLGDPGFWLGVALLAGAYGTFALGLQLNAGYTGLLNFGQAGFMAIGAYAMAILVAKAGLSFWLALPLATLVAMAAGVLVGLPTLRLRADYFAIVTIAFAEIVRNVAQNVDGLTGGNQGLLGFTDQWTAVSRALSDWLVTLGVERVDAPLAALALVTWCVLGLGAATLALLVRTPWGRVLRAIREDEDAAEAVGKPTLSYKLQSVAIAAAFGAFAGFLLALNFGFLEPRTFDVNLTFIGYTLLILGGLASIRGVIVGAVVLCFVLEATRFLDLGISDEKVAALRFLLVGVLLLALVVFRPQGLCGRKEEMVLRG